MIMTIDEDSKALQAELADVKPLAPKLTERQRIKQASESELTVMARRQAAVSEDKRVRDGLVTDGIDLLDPWYPLEFRRDGVQLGVFKKLKQGSYPIEATLDLHRLTIEQASHEVRQFIKEAAAYDLRTLLIVHGKGHHSESPGVVLKTYVNSWLPEFTDVQAYVSSQARHGGLGAAYVLLRKSERKKLANRLAINQGRID
jgi:DNA-nicking Smr family endonuclease